MKPTIPAPPSLMEDYQISEFSHSLHPQRLCRERPIAAIRVAAFAFGSHSNAMTRITPSMLL
ncbi:hypothetical protein, partial [Devosia sp.]|uniref:hypothetical protein n=1 Tax=Devosia sp. TaxID=1871048 RepID=UPI002FCCAA65